MPNTSVEQIKDRLNIVDVIGSYLKLEKAGINYKARCPFHNEKSASFFVSPTRQSFYCFGCGEKGDIFTFVEKFEGLDFKGALKTLADRAGVKLSDFKQKAGEGVHEEKDVLYKITEEASLFFEQSLQNNKLAKEYLIKRGLSEEVIIKWRIGYAEDAWRELHDALLKKGFSKKDMSLAGLVKEKDGKYYDTFRSRIMFPISDASGRVIAFSGRIFPEASSPNIPKYLNSPETPIFHKSEVLYGWHFAKSAIRKLDYAVIVEGQMDLLLCHEAGVTNSVASSGTALTESHLQKIKMLSNRVIVAYDSDSAGEKASERAAELGLGLGMEVKVASLPKGEDPASMILKDKELWKQYLRESLHLVDFALNKLSRDKKGTALLKEVESKVVPYFAFIKSEIEKSHFIRKIADKIGVREEAIIKEVAKLKEGGKNLDVVATSRTMNPERMMAGLVFLNKDPDLLPRWQKISGEAEVASVLGSYAAEKELLLFEAEELGEAAEHLLLRLELETLQDKMRRITSSLDKASVEERRGIEEEITEISKRVSELSKPISK